VTPTTGSIAALQVGQVVRLTFLAGNLNTATYNHVDYTVTGKTATTFTVIMPPGASLPGSSSSTCSYSIQSYPHPPVIERVDPIVDNTWLQGTPNGVVISPNNSPDNYSATWEAYLQPTTAGTYIFQLDADDKARVLLDTGGGLVQIVEHNWTTPGSDVVGTFKQSAPIVLAVPGSPAARYRIRVEYVETTGDARCRLQWNVNGGTFVNIPQANQFTHTQGATYLFNRGTGSAGTATLTLTGHGLINGDSATVWFSAGNLFTPNLSDPAGYSGTFPVSNATANTFEIPVSGTNLPANVTTAAACFLQNRPTSTTTGQFNLCYSNTAFANSPGRVGVDAAVTASNNGIWGSGTPDANLIQPDTFSIRWTGQVQPQFSEEYYFVVNCDDGVALKINGQPQVLTMSPSADTAGSTYAYDATTGTLTVNYSSLIVNAGSFIVGETLRVNPTSGNLFHSPNTPPTYSYDGSTGLAVIDYTNLTTSLPNPGANRLPGSYTVGESVEIDPTSGSAGALGNQRYVITAVSGNTFTVCHRNG
jgi:hypothetical protein